MNAPAHKRHVLTTIARIFFGFGFSVFGLNGFLNFIPQPREPMAPGVTDFMNALMATHYMIPLISGTELLAGVLLLTNRFVPLGLALLAPLIVNIFAFHLVLERSGLIIAVVFTLIEIYLAWSYRRSFGPMLAARTTPGAA